MEPTLFTQHYYLAEALDYWYLMGEDDGSTVNILDTSYGMNPPEPCHNDTRREGAEDADLSTSLS